MLYQSFLKPLLFLFSPEKVHYFVTGALKRMVQLPFIPSILRSIYLIENPALEREVFGLKFKNPVGLAAGFDKNAEYIDEFSHLGFGFIEIGTVTPKGQPGNPKPRLFRLVEDQAVLNRMGFNNDGVEKIKERLIRRKSNLIIGGNLGKNKITPNEEALQDYLISFRALFDYVDYFVVNVSSPNTPNLRDLQEKKPLEDLLKNLQNVKLDGLIATNTTISRTDLKDSTKWEKEMGGISGRPLTKRSTEIIRYLHNALGKEVPIIGVGGIMNAQDALDKLGAGAVLVQIYSGFIFEGPTLIKKINQAILDKNS